MAVQFLPALVMVIQRIEEGHRVGNVDEHRPVQRGSRLPDRVQSRVVKRSAAPLIVGDTQAKGLPDLQALRAPGSLLLQPPCCPLAKAGPLLRPLCPVHAAKDAKAIRGLGLKQVQMAAQNLFAPAAVQVDVLAHARSIELF